MGAIKLSLDDAPDFFGKQLQQAIKVGALKGLYSAALLGVVEILTRIIPQLVPEPVDRGVYKAGWQASEDPDGASIENSAPHAKHIEFGVRPGSIKVGGQLVVALAEWVIRKGIADQAEATSVAWAIARGMQRKGIFGQGLQVMAQLDGLLPDIVEQEVAREIERAISGV